MAWNISNKVDTAIQNRLILYQWGSEKGGEIYYYAKIQIILLKKQVVVGEGIVRESL